MKLAIGSDHGGYELKEGLKQYLANKGFDMVDDMIKCIREDWYTDGCWTMFNYSKWSRVWNT